MQVLQTPRLTLRPLTPDDAAFIVELVNDPSWLRFIGDKNIRDVEGARRYLAEGPIRMYEQHGFGMLCVESRETGERVGVCGLVKRDKLEDVDLGYALRPRHWGQGLAREAAVEVMRHATEDLGMRRVVAITAPGNAASQRLLEKLGFVREELLDWTPPVILYASSPRPPHVAHPDPANERAIPEGCHILESWNDPSDRAVSIARARVAPGEATRPHRLRGVVERYLVVEGRGRVTLDAASHDVGPGDVVVIPAGVSQSIVNTGNEDLVFYCICSPRFTPECYEEEKPHG